MIASAVSCSCAVTWGHPIALTPLRALTTAGAAVAVVYLLGFTLFAFIGVRYVHVMQ